MGQDSNIEWTHHTFNPWRGCTKVSEGCKNCYADTLSKRNPKALGVWGPNGQRVVAAESYWREPLKWNREAEAAGERRRVFCASLADVFEDWGGRMYRGVDEDGTPCVLWHSDDVGIVNAGQTTVNRSRGERLATMADVRRRLFKLICNTPNLDWLLLTKRPENALRMMVEAGLYAVANPSLPRPQPNLWLGTSVENQDAADERIPHLLNCPAAVRFLSCEPLLGPIDLTELPVPRESAARFGFTETFEPKFNALTSQDTEHFFNDHPQVDWVIVGGESGTGARPMHPDWARSIRDQCRTAGVAFFFKQWGAWEPVTPLYISEGRDDSAENGRGDLEMVDRRGHIWDEHDGQPNDKRTWLIERVGKKTAGRLLDGRTWDEFPGAMPATAEATR